MLFIFQNREACEDQTVMQKDEKATLTALVSYGEVIRELKYDFCVLKKEEGQPGDKNVENSDL